MNEKYRVGSNMGYMLCRQESNQFLVGVRGGGGGGGGGGGVVP